MVAWLPSNVRVGATALLTTRSANGAGLTKIGWTFTSLLACGYSSTALSALVCTSRNTVPRKRSGTTKLPPSVEYWPCGSSAEPFDSAETRMSSEEILSSSDRNTLSVQRVEPVETGPTLVTT